MIAPDCGMKYLPREAAFAKMCAMVDGARIVRAELSGRRPGLGPGDIEGQADLKIRLYDSVANASGVKGMSVSRRPSWSFDAHSGSTSSARPTATRSTSPRSSISIRPPGRP